MIERFNNWLYKELIPTEELDYIDHYIIFEERTRMKRDYIIGKIIDYVLTIVLILIMIALIIWGIKEN